MPLGDYIRPWAGEVYRHIPDRSPYPVDDFRFAGLGPDNRWNDPGEPTLYIASDAGLALAEFARHLERDYDPGLQGRPTQRRMYRLHLRLGAVLDFCDPNAWAALGGLADPPTCFLDRAVARATARSVRAATPAVAIRVPSVAFLDDLTRWSLVIFLEKLPDDPRKFVLDVTDVGFIRVGG